MAEDDYIGYELPLEIVELIIEEVCHDRQTLRAASLVCVIWRTAAFPYLLRDVLISEEADYDRIKTLCERFPRLSTYHIRSITLRPGSRGSTEMSMAEAFRSLARLFEDQRWELNSAAAEFPPMPRVTTLRWIMGRDVRHSIIVGPTIHRYISLFPSLQRLTLKARFEDLHEFELFLGLCCSQLKSLTLQGVWFRKSKSRPLILGSNTRVCDLGSLEKLAFERTRTADPSYDEIVDLLLLFLKTRVSLQALRIRYDISMSPTSLERLLDRSKETLQSLVIEPIGLTDQPLWGHSCRPFAHIGPQVQTLTIGVPTIAAPSSLTNSAPLEVVDFFRFVNALPPLPHITSLSITFRIRSDWDALEMWGPSPDPERDMKTSWHRFLSWLAAQMPSLNLLIFFVKLKKQFSEKEHDRFFAYAKEAVPPLRPGIGIQLQWVHDDVSASPMMF